MFNYGCQQNFVKTALTAKILGEGRDEGFTWPILSFCLVFVLGLSIRT